MAYQRLQVSNAIDVIPSDTVPIPDPSSFVLRGVGDFSVAGIVTNPTTTFTTDGIQKNAIIYNYTANEAYIVTDVVNDTKIALSPSSAGGAADTFLIFNAPALAATLYVGGNGNISVEMASNRAAAINTGLNPTVFAGITAGTFMPTLVTKVLSSGTTATPIKALF